MNPPLAPLHTHELRLSSMSEIDSFSDSDWLDIASNRESDNDSLSSRGSDHNEVVSSSHSRRSSFSTSSSRDGEVEAWEGFVEDSADEARHAEDHPASTGEAPYPSLIDDPEKGEDSAEERRVREGLDQSLMSTLSASRSSGSHPSTVHNSLRDLRLSFPDPLTSSRDELNRSYDKVSPSDIHLPATEADDVAALVTMEESIPIDDPGLPSTPEVSDLDMPVHFSQCEKTSFDIVLYGSSSPSKWTFVYDLLQKDAAGSGRSPLLETLRSLGIESAQDNVKVISNQFVLDRTDCIEDSGTVPRSDISPDRPSLAVVYLPCGRFTLARHSLYLPVVVSSTDETFEKDFQQAENDWSAQAVPMHRVLRLEGSSSGLLFAAEDVDKLDPIHTHKALQRLYKPVIKTGLWGGILEQFNSVHAVTLFALLCIGIATGISINPSACFRAQPLKGMVASPTTRLPFSTISGCNNSAIAIRTTSNLAIVPASPNHAPAVYHRGSTPPSTPSVSPSRSPEPVDSASEGSKLMSWAERMRVSKEVIIRPPNSMVAEVPSKHATPPSHPVTASEFVESSTAMSLRLASSVSEVVGASMKALIEVVHDDMKELLLAIDELVNALHRQTRMIVEQSRSAVQIVREHFDYRNARARGKAREIKERGLQLMSYAGDKFLDRTHLAKQRAQAFREKFITSCAWNAYTKAHGEWADKLRGRSLHTKSRLHPQKEMRDRRNMDFI